MVAQNRATLKAEFETGDVPDGTDYENLIDSFISITDTSAQSVASPISFSASAAFTGTVTAASMDVLGALRVSAATSLASTVAIGGALTVVTAETTTGVTAATAAVTAPASAVKALKVTVSGNTYAILLYNVV